MTFSLPEDLWFRNQQKLLLRMANTTFGRDLLCIPQEYPKILLIRKNCLHYRLSDGRYQADFRVGAKWGNVIRTRWPQFQSYSRYFLNQDGQIGSPLTRYARSLVALTLTVYPDPHPETTSVDGWARSHSKATFALAHDDLLGSDSDDPSANTYFIECGKAVATYQIMRGFFLYDTSALTASATISAATLSLYSTTFSDGKSSFANIYSSSPASNTAIVTSDYPNVGTTAFCDTPVAFSAFTGGYLDFAFNASGLAAISKTGVSKFSARNSNYDVANVDPGAGATPPHTEGYYSEQTGTSNDPKLVVTYTLASAATGDTFLLMGV